MYITILSPLHQVHRSQAKKSLASWLRRSKLWPFTADTCGSASLLYVSMTLLKRQKWNERHQPEMPQEGAEMLLFHKTQLLPTPSTTQRRRQCWIERRIVVLCADRQETLQGVKKKRKKKRKSPENHCCSPRKISSALRYSVAISCLTTAASSNHGSVESLCTYSLFFSRLASNHSTKFFFSMLSIVRL